jgi:hypothetical protein
VCSEPNLQWNPNGTDRNHRYLDCCILMRNTMSSLQNGRYSFAIYSHFSFIIFDKNNHQRLFHRKLIHKINEIPKIHQKKYLLGFCRYCFLASILFFCFSLLMLIYLTYTYCRR